MVKSKLNTRAKKRPPRIFIKGKKLYIQVGKKKILLKDAGKYSKSDIIDILLKQLLVRRKRRKKGKITPREKKLNERDIRIFNEFERMNKNQSKGSSLKIPSVPTSSSKAPLDQQKEFYNAMLSFLKSTPTKDINVEVQREIVADRARIQRENQTARQRSQLETTRQQEINRRGTEAQQTNLRALEAQQEQVRALGRLIDNQAALNQQERDRERALNQRERDLQREINQQELVERLQQQERTRQELVERVTTGLVNYQENTRPQGADNQPNIEPLLRQIDELQIDVEAKQALINKQSIVGILQGDILKVSNSNKKQQVKKNLKVWADAYERETGQKIDYGTYNNKPKPFSRAGVRDIFDSIIRAYGGLESDKLLTDYTRFRSQIVAPLQSGFQVEEEVGVPLIEEVEEEKELKEGKEPGDRPPPLEEEPERVEAPSSFPEIKSAEDFLMETERAIAEQKLDTSSSSGVSSSEIESDADDESSSSEEDLGVVASQVLGQIGDGSNIYTNKKGLSTQEIDNMLKPILGSSYLGTLPADFYKFIKNKKLPKRFGFVMNTDPSNKEGKHWVAVIVDLKNDMSVEYYDSFGRSPSKKFMKEIKKIIDKMRPNTYLKMKSNGVKHQSEQSQNCGFFSAKFLIDRLKLGVPFKKATKYEEQPDKSIEGENNINTFKNNKFGYI